MKKYFKDVCIWLIVAFFLGGAVNLGRKTVNHLWPDKPTTIEVINK